MTPDNIANNPLSTQGQAGPSTYATHDSFTKASLPKKSPKIKGSLGAIKTNFYPGFLAGDSSDSETENRPSPTTSTSTPSRTNQLKSSSSPPPRKSPKRTPLSSPRTESSTYFSIPPPPPPPSIQSHTASQHRHSPQLDPKPPQGGPTHALDTPLSAHMPLSAQNVRGERTHYGGGTGSGSGSGGQDVEMPHSAPVPGREKGLKKRPRPLDLRSKSGLGVGIDPELQAHMDEIGSAVTAISVTSDGSLENDLQDLSLLRNTMRQNLLERPLDSPSGSDSAWSSLYGTFRRNSALSEDIDIGDLIDIPSFLEAFKRDSMPFIVDTRSLGDHLDGHIPNSANISIPSLILKRLKKGAGTKPTWNGLSSFISTPEGRDVWDKMSDSDDFNIVLIGSSSGDDVAISLRSVLAGLINGGWVKVLAGGWQALINHPDTPQSLFQPTSDEVTHSEPYPTLPPPPGQSNSSDITASLPTEEGGNTNYPFLSIAPPTPPMNNSGNTSQDPIISRLHNQASMPSLRTKRGVDLPALKTGEPKRTPKLSLNLDNKPLKSATIASFPWREGYHEGGGGGGGGGGGMPALPRLDINASTANKGKGLVRDKQSNQSLQSLCHEQSKEPPSPSSFGDIKAFKNNYNSPGSISNNNRDDGADDQMTAQVIRDGGGGGSRNALSPFIVSTILPGFLYLGPEITTKSDVVALKNMGVRRILNVALECEDETLSLKEKFEKYLKIPMKDTIEESGVKKGIKDACAYLDDARLHSAATYVHCRAGKSRSVTVVLAYLIHANAWTLKTSYAYVAERRKGISPNIGFVAELMQFEESELGLKQSKGIHHNGNDDDDDDESKDPGRNQGGNGGDRGENGKEKGKGRARESLPPAWQHHSASLDSGGSRHTYMGVRGGGGEDQDQDQDQNEKGKNKESPERKVDDREVRKNGQWVHQRRAPVDRSTLQPSRRVSKAGLESLRPLANLSDNNSIPKPSPQPSPTAGEGAATPVGDGRLGWV